MTTHVLLWSRSQNCFHIEPMAKLLATNFDAFVGDRALNDYHLIACGSDEHVRQMADELRPQIHKRDKRRQLTPSPVI